MGFLDEVRNSGLPGAQKPKTTAPARTGHIVPLTHTDGTTPYAAEALEREMAAVAGAAEGTRNHTLNTAAYNMAQLVAGGQISMGTVWQGLMEAGKAAGLHETEIVPTLRSGLNAGQEQPRTAKPDPVAGWLDRLPTRTPTTAPPTPQNGAQPRTEQEPDECPTNTGPANHADPTTVAAATPGNTTHPDPQPKTNTAGPALPWLKTNAQSAGTGSTNSGNASPSSPEQSTPTTSTDWSTGETDLEDAPADAPTVAEFIGDFPQFEWNKLVAKATIDQQVREQAAREVKRQRDGTPPTLYRLPDFLARPLDDPTYRCGGLWPTGGRIILAAQYKAGKSTAIGNMLRALADGDPFLGRYETVQAEKIVLIDNELDPRTLQRWLGDQGIENPDRVYLYPIRGHVSYFDILDPVRRKEIAEQIKGADVVILDCLRPVLDSLGLSEDKDAGKFLVAFDQLLAEAGASEAIVVHHMGHGGARSRGDSRILDWPDATWSMHRDDPEDPNSARYFSAFGRDVKVDESLLHYDPVSRHLTLTGGSRKQSKQADIVEAILKVIALHPDGPSGRDLEGMVTGTATDIRAALKTAVAEGRVLKLPGRSGGFKYVLPMPKRTDSTYGQPDPNEPELPEPDPTTP